MVLVLLTLCGALPVYRRVAEESPHGQGSVAMLERLLSFWQGKLFVLVLLGFAATDFMITITLSAADASAHVVENPHVAALLHDQQVLITLSLITLLGVVFLRGFTEAMGLAVALVGIYLALNAVVMTRRGRPHRHRGAAGGPHPAYQEAAGHGRAHHERLPHRQQPGHHVADPAWCCSLRPGRLWRWRLVGRGRDGWRSLSG